MKVILTDDISNIIKKADRQHEMKLAEIQSCYDLYKDLIKKDGFGEWNSYHTNQEWKISTLTDILTQFEEDEMYEYCSTVIKWINLIKES